MCKTTCDKDFFSTVADQASNLSKKGLHHRMCLLNFVESFRNLSGDRSLAYLSPDSYWLSLIEEKLVQTCFSVIKNFLFIKQILSGWHLVVQNQQWNHQNNVKSFQN